MSRLVRIEPPHAPAGAPSFSTLYVCQCAPFLRQAFLSHESGQQARVAGELRLRYRRRYPEPTAAPLPFSIEASFLTDSTGSPPWNPRRATGLRYSHSTPPYIGAICDIARTFVANANEIKRGGTRILLPIPTLVWTSGSSFCVPWDGSFVTCRIASMLVLSRIALIIRLPAMWTQRADRSWRCASQ